jgi:hypothetical protein
MAMANVLHDIRFAHDSDHCARGIGHDDQIDMRATQEFGGLYDRRNLCNYDEPLARYR